MIREGDWVRVTQGPNQGLVGVVLAVYRADRWMRRRALVRFRLADGPYARLYGLDYLERVRA